MTELGRTASMYCELGSRTTPTVSDVQLALVDAGVFICIVDIVVSINVIYVCAGASIAGLSEYSKRPQRRHLPKRKN